jgi:FkbM family methyltransferase
MTALALTTTTSAAVSALAILIWNEYYSNLFNYGLSFVFSKWTKSCTDSCTFIDRFGNRLTKYFNKDGDQFYAFDSDSIISGVLRRGNAWEQFMHKYFRKYSNQNGVALDIGGNIGTHSVVLSRFFKKVYSFEPFVWDVLQKNLEINNIQNVEVIPLALSNVQTPRISKIKHDHVNVGASTIDPTNGDIQIQMNSLDNLNLNLRGEFISFVKIDVEGHEFEVLQGAEKMLRAYKPTMIIEIRPKNKKRCFAFLKNLGYRNFKKIMLQDYLITSTDVENIVIRQGS